MTVIRRKIHTYNNPNSSNNSDTESLNLGSTATSDTESLQNEPVSSRNRARIVNIFKLDDAISSRSGCIGKRKFRRHLNRSLLQTLNEEEEEESGFVKLIEDNKTPLSILLENESVLNFWNDFISKSEEEQESIIKMPMKGDKKDSQGSEKSSERYSKISSKIKRMIKIKKNFPFDLVEKLEYDIIDFFTNISNCVYVSVPNTSFERLLLHGIAQYHGLSSITVVMDSSRSVEVLKSKSDWAPCSCSFCDFVGKLRR